MPEASLPLQFRGFGAACAHDGATTYATISASAADDPELLALMEHAPPAQRRPNLLLAAVHYLLLSGLEDPLAAYYDTVRPAGAPAGSGDVAPVFHQFCLTHREEVCELLASRSTQTNEVGRSAVLLPALCAIAAQHGGGPISLLDLGTSAGLNLLFDRYGYHYAHAEDGTSRQAGDPSSGVQLSCDMRSPLDALPPLDLPTLVDRAGLDLTPVDATSEDEARWLLACLWPDNLPRFDRLRAALHLWRSLPARPRLVTGDMVEDLAAVATTVGDGEPLVVFHSWVAAYLTEPRQRDLVEAVQAIGRVRPVHHLYAELPFETPGLPMPEAPGAGSRPSGATALVHIGPGGEPERWGNVHPHGNWVRWFATPTGPRARPVEPAPAHRPG